MQKLPWHNPPLSPGESLRTHSVLKSEDIHSVKPSTGTSGFTPHRSTVDRIATLKLILQQRREYRKPCWVAYVDFRSAFDC